MQLKIKNSIYKIVEAVDDIDTYNLLHINKLKIVEMDCDKNFFSQSESLSQSFWFAWHNIIIQFSV